MQPNVADLAEKDQVCIRTIWRIVVKVVHVPKDRYAIYLGIQGDIGNRIKAPTTNLAGVISSFPNTSLDLPIVPFWRVAHQYVSADDTIHKRRRQTCVLHRVKQRVNRFRGEVCSHGGILLEQVGKGSALLE